MGSGKKRAASLVWECVWGCKDPDFWCHWFCLQWHITISNLSTNPGHFLWVLPVQWCCGFPEINRFGKKSFVVLSRSLLSMRERAETGTNISQQKPHTSFIKIHQDISCLVFFHSLITLISHPLKLFFIAIFWGEKSPFYGKVVRQTSESPVAATFPQTIIQLKVCGWMWFQSMGFSWQYIIGSKIDLCHQRSFQVCIWCLRKRVCQNVSQIHISPAIYLSFPHIKPFSQDTFITQTLSRRIDRIWNGLFNGDKQILVTLKLWKISISS